jgi:NAD(P)-dependent dehydrogenase (short-subunit alcohol dehydrogenase family)
MNKSVVLIAGGPTVIGSAAAVAFAKKGARVVAAGRRDEAGKALVKELRSFGSEAEFINAEVHKEDDVRALRSTRMFSASILNMKHEVRVTRGRGSGSILNMSSTYGHEGVAPRRSLPTRSCSSRRTKPRSSPATSSTSTAVTVRTDPVRATGIAQGSRLLRPTPD